MQFELFLRVGLGLVPPHAIYLIGHPVIVPGYIKQSLPSFLVFHAIRDDAQFFAPKPVDFSSAGIFRHIAFPPAS